MTSKIKYSIALENLQYTLRYVDNVLILTNDINEINILQDTFQVLQKTNIIYQFKCPLGDFISENNNIYIGLTSITLSRRLTMHLSDTSSWAQHQKKLMPHNWISENSYQKHNDIRKTK